MKNKNYLSSHEGFTLIELVVVIGVLAALFVGLITVVDPITQYQKSQDAKRKADLSQIQKVLETYYQDNGRYPTSSALGAEKPYRMISLAGTVVDWGDPFTPYMSVLPKDSDLNNNYVYVSTVDGQAYYLYASLKRGGKDQDACHADGAKCDSAPNDGCGGVCNYGITSPNVSP